MQLNEIDDLFDQCLDQDLVGNDDIKSYFKNFSLGVEHDQLPPREELPTAPTANPIYVFPENEIVHFVNNDGVVIISNDQILELVRRFGFGLVIINFGGKQYEFNIQSNGPNIDTSITSRDLSSLQDGQHIAESVINDWAYNTIRLCNKFDTILYMPPEIFRCFRGKIVQDSEKLIRFIVNNRVLEKDIVFICIPAETNEKHLMLGSIDLNNKRIAILDPNQIDGLSSRQDFDCLLRFLLVAYRAYKIWFNIEEWTCCYPTRITRQLDEVDCGVMICSYIHRLASNVKLADIDPKEGRRRIKHILSISTKAGPLQVADICTPELIAHLVDSLAAPIPHQLFENRNFGNASCNYAYRPTAPVGFQQCEDLYCPVFFWNKVSTAFFCHGCRKWHHKCCSLYEEHEKHLMCYGCRETLEQ